MASAARLNARVRRAERQVAALHEDELVRAYRAALGGLARDIADRFTYEATHTPVEALAAAGYDESKHPRVGKGQRGGGQWTRNVGGGIGGGTVYEDGPYKIASRAVKGKAYRTAYVLSESEQRVGVASSLDRAKEMADQIRSGTLPSQTEIVSRLRDGAYHSDELWGGDPAAMDGGRYDRSRANLIGTRDMLDDRDRRNGLDNTVSSIVTRGGTSRRAQTAAGAPETAEPPPPPRWVPPPGPALYAAVARAGAVKKIRSVQAAILTEMQNRVAIGFDVVGAPSQTLLDNLGARADEALSAAVREPVATAMANAYREGDTIVEAARAIRAAVNDAKVWQAVMLARTDLIGIANGSSLLQARALNAAAPTPIITTKKWLATNDNRTRHTHREADGQEVPIDARFSVGNSQLDYPGDPHGSDSEVINCRCTVLLLEAPTKAALRAAGPWDPTKHPRHPRGDDRGGEWAPRYAVSMRLPDVDDGLTRPEYEALYAEIEAWEGTDDQGAFAEAYLAIREAQAPHVGLIQVREGGELKGVMSFEIRSDGAGKYVRGADAGAVDGAGLAVFKAMVDYAAGTGLPMRFWATPSAGKLYRRLGFPETSPLYFELEPEDLRALRVDLFSLAREERAIAASGYVFDFVLLAAGPWDETMHPRHPEGTTMGGRFAPKVGSTGTDKERAAPPKTAKEAGRRIAASVLARQLRGLDETVDEIRALEIPTGEYAGPAVYMKNGGGSFNRMPDGRYIIDGAALSAEGWDPTRYATADEAIAAMRAKLLRPELEAEVAANWAKRLRGGVMADRDVLGLFTSGDIRNAESASYREFTTRWGVHETPVVVLNEKGMAAFNKDFFTSGFYDPGTGVIYMNGDSARTGLDLIAKNELKPPPGREPYHYGTKVGPMLPGDGSGGATIDGLIRHETAHAAWANMPQEFRDEFTASVPADYETRATLTRYAADAPEVYAESMRGADAAQFPWQGEVHSEVVAATMDPEYDRTLWPPWVNEMGDRIRELQP